MLVIALIWFKLPGSVSRDEGIKIKEERFQLKKIDKNYKKVGEKKLKKIKK